MQQRVRLITGVAELELWVVELFPCAVLAHELLDTIAVLFTQFVVLHVVMVTRTMVPKTKNNNKFG